jgi:predicted nucleic acid-binding protein
MVVVSNSTPLIGLAVVDQFDLLRAFFGEIMIAQAVYDETVTRGRETDGARREVVEASWVKVVPVQDRLAVQVLLDELDLGEAETIVLAQELSANLVLMDEKKGRRKLKQMRIPKIGTLGILLQAKALGLIPAVRPLIERLRQMTFSMSDRLVAEVLRTAGEM